MLLYGNMSLLPKGIFITGTDTGVGKTVVTAALALCLERSGADVAVMKPVQTGTDNQRCIDIEFVGKVLGRGFDIDLVCPYRLGPPLAPSLAAEMEGVEIEPRKIIDAFKKSSAEHEVVLVEGAGGLMAPVKGTYLMCDLAGDMGLGVIVVCRPGLGTINHTLLSIEAAESRGLDVLGVVISNFPMEMPGMAERTNPRLLVSQTDVPIIGVVAHDAGVCVEEGRIGSLGDTAARCFTPAYGGEFSLDNFLKRLEG